MTEIEALNEQIRSVRVLLWNASQLRRSRSVFRLTAELDRLVAQKRRLEDAR